MKWYDEAGGAVAGGTVPYVLYFRLVPFPYIVSLAFLTQGHGGFNDPKGSPPPSVLPVVPCLRSVGLPCVRLLYSSWFWTVKAFSAVFTCLGFVLRLILVGFARWGAPKHKISFLEGHKWTKPLRSRLSPERN